MEPEPLLYDSEDRWSAMVKVGIDRYFQQEIKPPNWLEQSESPFKWMASLDTILLLYANLTDKIRDYKNQGPDYGFEKYTLLLSVVFMREYELLTEASDEESEDEELEDEVSVAAEDDGCLPLRFRLVDPEQAYVLCRKALDEMAAREGDVMFTRIGPAMEHVLQATRAHMLYLNGKISDSKEIAANIKPLEEMSPECFAGIEGIKAKFITFVYQNMDPALDACRKAEELDPTFGAWKHLTGKILRRVRRDKRKTIDANELEYFIKAVELERHPRFIVFLAQAYQEMGFSILKKENVGTPDEAHEMLDKAVDLYRECWRLKNDSAAIARRVGNGMMKMKDQLDVHLTKEALLKAVELSPNTVTFHSLGKFYLNFEQNEEKALACFKKVGAIYGIGEIIRFNMIKSYPDYDPIPLIEYWIDLARNIVKRDMLYCDVGWYYLVLKNDLFTAVQYFWKILRKTFDSFRVLEFSSFAFCVEGPVNMLRVLVNEIMLSREENEVHAVDREKVEFLNMFLEKVFEKHPDLCEITPNPDLLPQLKHKVEKYIQSRRKKNQRRVTDHTRNEAPGSWRTRNSDSVGSNEHEENRATWNNGRFMNERGNRNNVEELRRRGSGPGPENQNSRSGMRFGGRQTGFRSYGTDRTEEGTLDERNNPRLATEERGHRAIQDTNPRFDNRNRESSYTRPSDDATNRFRNQPSRPGREMENRRQQTNNYNTNRYDTTITNWRSRNSE